MSKNQTWSEIADIVSIILVLTLIAAGQTFAKIGIGKTGHLPFGLNGFLLLSYTAFLMRGVIWSLILRRHPVSRVYPYLALSYPLVLAISLLFFAEELSAGKVGGSFLIFAGTFLMIQRGKR